MLSSLSLTKSTFNIDVRASRIMKYSQRNVFEVARKSSMKFVTISKDKSVVHVYIANNNKIPTIVNCVKVYLHYGQIRCNCYKSFQSKNICKHCCFVILHILRDHNLNYFQTKSCSNLNITLKPKPHLISYNTKLYFQILNILSFENTVIKNDDICCICMTDMLPNKMQFKCKCILCNNSFHSICMHKWLTISDNPVCPLCRETSWSQFYGIYIRY